MSYQSFFVGNKYRGLKLIPCYALVFLGLCWKPLEGIIKMELPCLLTICQEALHK